MRREQSIGDDVNETDDDATQRAQNKLSPPWSVGMPEGHA